MSKARLNFWIDTLLLLALLGEAVSGFVLWLVLPAGGGFRGGRGLDTIRSFIFTRHTWLAVHDWLAVLLVVGIVIHLALHWKWIVCMAKGLFKRLQAPQGDRCMTTESTI